MYYDKRVRVHVAALKHGVGEHDAMSAAIAYLVSVTIDDDQPGRELRLGFDTAGRLLETIVLRLDDGSDLIIHAMKARSSYLYLVPDGWLR